MHRPGASLSMPGAATHGMYDRHGRGAAAMMPKADSVIAVLADVDVSWHRLLIPKAPGNRLRAALAGMMEEVLLDDTEQAHFALGPDARPGEIGLVAVTNGRWLGEQLAILDRANLTVDRIAPMAWPSDPPNGHFTVTGDEGGAGGAITLSWADGNGVAVLDVQGGLARALLPLELPPEVHFSATPGCSGRR